MPTTPSAENPRPRGASPPASTSDEAVDHRSETQTSEGPPSAAFAFRLSELRGRGVGCVAVRAIKRGEVLIAEQPVIHVSQTMIRERWAAAGAGAAGSASSTTTPNHDIDGAAAGETSRARGKRTNRTKMSDDDVHAIKGVLVEEAFSRLAGSAGKLQEGGSRPSSAEDVVAEDEDEHDVAVTSRLRRATKTCSSPTSRTPSTSADADSGAEERYLARTPPRPTDQNTRPPAAHLQKLQPPPCSPPRTRRTPPGTSRTSSPSPRPYSIVSHACENLEQYFPGELGEKDIVLSMYDAWEPPKTAFGVFVSNAFHFTSTKKTSKASKNKRTKVAKNTKTNTSTSSSVEDNFALYPLIGKLNHSCSANVGFSHGGESGKTMRVFAVRDISAGEELTICYNYEQCFERKIARRKFFEENFRFLCCCRACCGGGGDAENKRGETRRRQAQFVRALQELEGDIGRASRSGAAAGSSINRGILLSLLSDAEGILEALEELGLCRPDDVLEYGSTALQICEMLRADSETLKWRTRLETELRILYG